MDNFAQEVALGLWKFWLSDFIAYQLRSVNIQPRAINVNREAGTGESIKQYSPGRGFWR